MSHWYKNKSYKGIEKDPHRKKKEDSNLRKKNVEERLKKPILIYFTLFIKLFILFYWEIKKSGKLGRAEKQGKKQWTNHSIYLDQR